MTSATVIVALIGVKLGYSWLDPVAALVVAVFIGVIDRILTLGVGLLFR